MPVKLAVRYCCSHKIKTAFYVFFAALICYSFATGQQQDSPSIEILDIAATSDGKVQVSVAVTDKKGNPIEGLNRDSFTLHVGEKRIHDFSFRQTSEDPLSVAILVDVSGSMAGVPIVETKKIIAQFLGYLKEYDYAALVTFGTDTRKVIGFTKDKEIIYGKVDELKAVENKTVLFKAVTDCLKISASSPTAKSAILLFTDSKDEHSRIDEADVIAAAKESHIPIYTIALGKYKYIDFLKTISYISGGQSFILPKYEDIVRLGRAASAGLKARYKLEFPFSAANGKYSAVIKFNYHGSEVTAQKDFTNDITKDSRPPSDSQTGYPPKGGATVNETRPGSSALLYLLLGFSAITVLLLVHIARTRNKPALHDIQQSADIRLLHGEITATAGMLADMDSEIKAASEKNSEHAAALSTEVMAVYKQISTLSQQIKSTADAAVDAVVDAMKRSMTDMERSLKDDAPQAKYEHEFAAIKAELSALKDSLSGIISRQIEHSERQSLESAESAKNLDTALAGNEKHVVEAIEKIEHKLNEIDASITNLDTEIKAHAAADTVKGSINGMEHGLREASVSMYKQEIGGMREEVAAVKDALTEVMRFLLILSE